MASMKSARVPVIGCVAAAALSLALAAAAVAMRTDHALETRVVELEARRAQRQLDRDAVADTNKRKDDETQRRQAETARRLDDLRTRISAAEKQRAGVEKEAGDEE